ncbi:MAG TPA: hypothetical protein VFO67_09965, partial [Gemmatimonadales bacterium]|nr:hypothetical protein [Gemmatimonadales bacterium]
MHFLLAQCLGRRGDCRAPTRPEIGPKGQAIEWHSIATDEDVAGSRFLHPFIPSEVAMVSGKALVLAGVLTISGLGCALNPATGKRQLSLISETQEVELGREAAQQVQRTLGFVNDPDLQ